MIIFITFGLITMSSQSADSDAGTRLYVPIPKEMDSNWNDWRVLDSEKLGQAIADEFSDIARVYDIYFILPQSTLGVGAGQFYFSVVFTVETTKGDIHSLIRCSSVAENNYTREHRIDPRALIMQDCGNGKVVFEKTRIEIPLNAISYKSPIQKRAETE